jgi:hypothetical protein
LLYPRSQAVRFIPRRRKEIQMRPLMILLVTATLSATGASAARADVGFSVSANIDVNAAPPAPRYYAIPAERPNYVWVQGAWAWDGYQWIWHDGYWQPARAESVWVDGAWVQAGPRWRWRAGYWQPRRDGYDYVRGRWGYDRGRWVWYDGRWEARRPYYNGNYNSGVRIYREGQYDNRRDNRYDNRVRVYREGDNRYDRRNDNRGRWNNGHWDNGRGNDDRGRRPRMVDHR